MALRPHTARRVLVCLVVGAAAAPIGYAYSAVLGGIPRGGAVTGLLIGASLTTLGPFYVQRPRGAWLRRPPSTRSRRKPA